MPKGVAIEEESGWFVYSRDHLASAALTRKDAGMGNDDLQTMLNEFVTVFNNLDWPAFRSMFTEEATVFAPGPPVTTLTTVVGCFQPVF
jgi:hypothetical protein